MKTRVNLYLPELRPRRVLVTLEFCLAVWLLAALGMGGASFWMNQQAQSAKAEAQPLLQMHQQKQTEVQQLTQRVANRKVDRRLEQQIQALQQQLQAKQLLVGELEQQSLLKNEGFAPLLQALADAHDNRLWLTRIHVQERQLHLAGATTAANAVPQWISQLQQNDYFVGKSFERARLFEDD